MSDYIHVAVLAFPGVQLLDVIGPLDVFAEATKQLGGTKGYKVSVIGTSKDPIVGSSGIAIIPNLTIDEPGPAVDTLLVAGSPDVQIIAANPALQEWLRQVAPRARRHGSVCSGAFVLAAAGLLDGKQVTTHWNAASELAEKYPTLQIDPDRIFLKDGSTYTSAGVTAGMDLALALVEEDFGREIALRVARELVMFLKRPGGQSQFSAHLAAQVGERTAIKRVQSEILADLKADHSVNNLAKRAAMSPRNFARIFRQEAKMTPAEFVAKARVDAARRMLEDTQQPLQRIATQCGFETVNNLRRAFLRQLGTTPLEYRKRFKYEAA